MFCNKWMRLLPAAALVCAGLAAEAKVELAPVFSDNAVLQRDMNVPVWGFADPGESVTVKFADQTRTTTAGKDGKWMVKLFPLAASSQNRTLEAVGKNNTASAKNIVVGEVWIASGQSNMELPLWSGNPRFRHRNANATGKQVADKTNLPLLRFVHMPCHWSATPSEKEPIVWHPAVAGTDLEKASAAAFFFGRELLKELKVPVGILGAYWGGTRIEPWTPPEGFDAVPALAGIAKNVNAKIPGTKAYQEVSRKVDADYTAWLARYKAAVAKGEAPPVPPEFPVEQKPFTDHQQPTVLYNKMLYGFVPYAVRGAIWYQGEANLYDGALYEKKMEALLKGWETVFHNPRMKFYFVQLAPFAYGGDPTRLPLIWEAQQKFADNERNAGMVVVTDAVNDIHDIHPGDKEIVGKRLAGLALNRDYGRNIKADSPELMKSTVENGKYVLEFTNVESWKHPGKDIPFFEVTGADGQYVPAQVKIDGKKLIVWSDQVSAPKGVRYMWNQTDQGKLANEAGLVLGAFRIGYNPTFSTVFDCYRNSEKLIYQYDLKSGSGFGDKTKVRYLVDNNASIKGRIIRITYLAQLITKNGKEEFVAVSMDAFTAAGTQTGIPVKSTGATFQTKVNNLSVLSNVPGVKNGMFREGNIEFWPNNYGTYNTARIPGANNGTYDFGDQMTNPAVGYGSMQIHNFGAKQTVFAYNNFGAGSNADLGIGNNPDGQPDWTFTHSANRYGKATLYVFVKLQ